MGLGFLAPLFLIGLLAVAVPVYVHLTHREKHEPVAFPSLMFLRQVPYRESRRRHLRHWLLFALRTAAFALLAAAFARPLLQRAAGAATATAPRDVIILADRSLSMGQGDRWPRVRDAAREVVAALGAEDRASLVLFDDGAEASGQPTGDKAELERRIAGATPGSGGTRYAGAFQVARDLLDDPSRRREVVLITDFQRGGWDGRMDARLRVETRLTRVDVGEPAANLSVGVPAVARVRRANRDEIIVTARLASSDPAPPSTVPRPPSPVPVSLTIDGRTVETVRVAVEPNGTAAVRFAPVPEPPRETPAMVTLPADALPADDTSRVVLAPAPRVPVLLVHGDGAATGEGLYLERAFAVGTAPAFPVTLRRAGQVTAADLDAARVIVLHDAALSVAAAARLLTRVRAGAGLLITIARQAALPAGLSDSIARVAPASDRTGDGGGVLSVASYDHPVFAPFARPRSGDVTAARAFRYRPLVPAPGAAVLARYDDGSAALVERGVGAGRVAVWGSDLGNRWNDLPLQPVFVPLVHHIVRYLADYADQPVAREAGRMVDLAAVLPAADSGALVVEGPADDRVSLAADAPRQVMLRAAGFYSVRPQADRGRTLALMAVNPDPAESDLARIDPEELALAVAPQGRDDGAIRTAGPSPSAEVLERRQVLWWYLLLGVLLLLGAETLVASRTGAR